MPPKHCPPLHSTAFLVLLLLAAPCLAPTAAAQTVSTGDYALPNLDPQCHEVSGIIERNLPGFAIVPGSSFAFKGGRLGGQFCLQTLMPASGEFLTDAAFMVTILGSDPMEELTTPMCTSQAPLEDCWPTRIGFDDINQDDIPDILMLIGCYNGEAGAPANDNVLYLSHEDAAGDAHYRQTTAMNQVVSTFADYAQAKNAAVQALSIPGSAPAAKQTQTATAPKPKAVPAPMRTCTYETDWGLMTLRFDNAANTVNGTYTYRDGRVSGFMRAGVINGTWQESEGQGSFFFKLIPEGFEGSWNHQGDSGWQGPWNGRLVQCR